MPPTEGSPVQENDEKTIIFDQSKSELFKINDNYKGVQRKLKVNWKTEINKDEITPEVLKDAAVFIVPSPREKFTENEFNTLKGYLDGGGSVLVTLGEGGEKKFETNINYLLEEYGIMINSDSVVRTHYYKYFHPKECLIPNGVLNRGIAKLLGKEVDKDFMFKLCLSIWGDIEYCETGSSFAVVRPDFMASKPPCMCDRIIVDDFKNQIRSFFIILYSNVNLGGKICVLGSGHVFADKYIEKEDNSQMFNVIMTYLTTDHLELNNIDMEDPEVSEYTVVADTCAVSERIRGCLIETTEDLPSDYMSLFNTDSFYWVSLDHVAQVISAFNELDVPHTNLKLAVPSFEESVPKLEPAVFPPRFLDLGPPALELYDLQEEFYSEVSRLSQTANKILTTSLKNAERTVGEKRPQLEAEIEDVEYFTLECGQILGINSTNVRQVLWQVSLLIGSFKKNLHK